MKFPTWISVYGNLEYRGACPPESAEQITLFNIIRKEYPHALHPRNEGKRTTQQVQRQKAEGMTAGAADIIIPSGLAFVCELKRQDHTKSVWQPKQLDFLKSCYDSGAFVCVALGYKSALEAIEEWKEQSKRNK